MKVTRMRRLGVSSSPKSQVSLLVVFVVLKHNYWRPSTHWPLISSCPQTCSRTCLCSFPCRLPFHSREFPGQHGIIEDFMAYALRFASLSTALRVWLSTFVQSSLRNTGCRVGGPKGCSEAHQEPAGFIFQMLRQCVHQLVIHSSVPDLLIHGSWNSIR